MRSCGYSQGFVLRNLNLSDAGGACIGAPDWGTVVSDRPSYCLVGHQYRLLLLSPGSACQGLQDVVSVADSCWTLYGWKTIQMEDYTDVRLYGWKTIRMEDYTDGRLYGCKTIRMEDYTDGRLYGWKTTRMEAAGSYHI